MPLFGGISGAFLCVPARFFWCGFPVFFVVLFLVSFADFAGGIFCAFPGAFSTVFTGAFFRAFFRACPFSFLYTFPLGGGPVFCRVCFRGFWMFLGVFSVFSFRVFFVSFIVFFFVHFFVLYLVLFFVCFFFFVPWVALKTNNHNILHFDPCFFRCFFWWSLLVKIGYTQIIE